MAAHSLVGIGLKREHYQQILEERPNIDWFEVHSENFFIKGGPAKAALFAIRKHYPISIHGIGLSLGSSSGARADHLINLKKLIGELEPFLVSEHLSWNQTPHAYLPDLLPVPYTLESMQVFIDNINKTQDFLKREILLENPSSYLEYADSDMSETDFIISLAQKTGAKILLDVNNIYVASSNHGWDAEAYIDAVPANLVKEIHLAGHSVKKIDEQQLIRIDTHDDFVCMEVWNLYAKAAAKFGFPPTLLEWDAKIPPLEVLIKEAHKVYNYHSSKEVINA